MKMNNIMEQYEKIRIVGKGAFGVAVLYRKLKTNQLVVLKEINTNDLTPIERELAKNEVEVLSVLNHENIISYGGSFEYQGNLMIEMEYADGGTLAQLLANSEEHFSERQILNLIQQICSALHHMHTHKILHRDLKTANVFMTADGIVKIGDFGISKVLTTNVQAQTVLGTPYYLSPEMCEGKDYNEKSDIWALGCILYEMCCLHKTFQASTLPALVNKIMKAEYKPIPRGYSENLKNLLKELLDKNPTKRPTALDILDKKIPDIVMNLGDNGFVYTEPELDMSTLRINRFQNVTSQHPNERSVLYQVKSFENNINIFPLQLPPTAKIKHIATSSNHFIAITEDEVVFTWGNGNKGQLGCGTTELWKQYPSVVNHLAGKNIVMCGAGEEFSIFLSRSGELYSCGDGSQGSLGHGDWIQSNVPKLIESLSGTCITSLSCGLTHTVALTSDGQLYSWGGGSKGQTGHNITHNVNIPTLIILPLGLKISSIHCGGDSTMIITTSGSLFACGCNKYNKLALERKPSLFSDNSSYVTVLKEVFTIPGKKMNCAIGIKHCMILTYVNNKSALYVTGHPFQMGATEDKIGYYMPERVKELNNIEINILKCGPTYSVVGTDDNCILLWGTRYGVRDVELNNTTSQDSSGVWSQHSHQKESISDDSVRTITDMLTAVYLPEIISKPISILALYSSPSQLSAGHMMILGDLFPLTHSVLVLVHTTTPLPRETQTNNIQLQDCDSIGPIPPWMQAEIDQSQYTWADVQ